MTTTTPPSPAAASNRRLLSARQAAWALSFLTASALVVGIAVVSVISGGSAPPTRIEGGDQPVVEQTSPFEILEQDDRNAAKDAGWPESLFPTAPSAELAREPDGALR